MLKIDLAVYNQNQQLVLTVEVKKMLGVTENWATQLRRNIVAHGYPIAPYFLLATPDKFFLWVGRNDIIQVTNPDYIEAASELLAPYFKEFNAEPTQVSEFIFEQIVSRWLKSMMYPGYGKADEVMPQWVSRSGLGKVIFQGDFSFEQAA